MTTMKSLLTKQLAKEINDYIRNKFNEDCFDDIYLIAVNYLGIIVDTIDEDALEVNVYGS